MSLYEKGGDRGAVNNDEKVKDPESLTNASNGGVEHAQSSRTSEESNGFGDYSKSENDGESDLSSDENSAAPAMRKIESEDGHELSEYEIMRLERIRRNKEYLASLGLEKVKPKPQQSQTCSRPKKKKSPEITSRRSSLSRNSKNKELSYAEKPIKDPTTDQKLPVAKRKKPHATGNKIQSRLDRFIYDEFRRMESESKRTLYQAEKNLRSARVEQKLAHKELEKYERKEKKRIEKERIVRRYEDEKRYLGGSKRELLQEFDRRTGEIKNAIRCFDEAPNARENLLLQAQQREENQRKMEMIDAARLFPRALKTATQELDTLLLERTPRDLPPPPRETRRRKANEAECDTENGRDVKREGLMVGEGRLTSSTVSGLAVSCAPEALDSGAATIDNDQKVAEQPEKPRKKRDSASRNVGGWVSPAFSTEIKRTWLEHETVAPEKFELSSFVPQVGDTLLYFPAGHRSFLKLHPDELGKKTRQILRLPLWERARREKEKNCPVPDGNDISGKKSRRAQFPTWWTDEWLASVEERYGTYPLLCRVERTHAEFPPDPNAEHRVVKKDQGAGSIRIVWNLPKGNASGPNSRKSDVSLSLAVTLRPLTPLLMGPNDSTDRSREGLLALPPLFTVATFPSRKAAPFLLPFSWAYRVWHSLDSGRLVKLKSDERFVAVVTSFKSLDAEFGDGRLDDKVWSIRHVLKGLRAKSEPFISTVEKSLVEAPWSHSASQATMSIVDALTVTNVLQTRVESESVDGIEGDSKSADIGLVDLIRSTFPLWKSVKVEGTAARRRTVNAWDLEPVQNEEATGSSRMICPSLPGTHPETGLACSLDDSLGTKLEFTIEEFVKGTPNASMFSQTLTDNDVPSYSCAVPLSMSFDRVLRRLSRNEHSYCYYRSVDALLSDISMILENCILFNSPDAEVVRIAREIIPLLKKDISTLASRHFKERKIREKKEEERRHAILLQTNSPVMVIADDASTDHKGPARNRWSSKKSKAPVPFEGSLQRSWLQSANPDGTCSQTPSSQRRAIAWIPQHGDLVYYSRFRHSSFVGGHNRSLTVEQCMLPTFVARDHGDNSAATETTLVDTEDLWDHLNKRWLIGRVIWVRAEFPRHLSIEDGSSETFDCPAPVLAVGISFCYGWAGHSSVYRVCWRPCALAGYLESPTTSENPFDVPNDCPGCGLSTSGSFLLPAWQPSDSGATLPLDILEPDLLSEPGTAMIPSRLSKEEVSSISRCFDVLKRRCIDGIPADYMDARLKNTDAIKRGWPGPSAKPGKVPTFPRLLLKGDSVIADQSSLGRAIVKTRGVENVDEKSVSLLADVHFLPPWMSALPATLEDRQKTDRGGIVKSIEWHGTISPSPNLCLELIQLRLRNDYYRRTSALVQDIREAYVTSVLLVLFESALRRRGKSFSIRKVAKAMSSREINKFLNNQESFQAPIPVHPLTDKFSEEELRCMCRIAPVRKLYGAAVVCATETVSMERIFGTLSRRRVTLSDNPSSENSKLEKIMAQGRQRLGYTLAALTKESDKGGLASGSAAPTMSIKITGAFGDDGKASFDDKDDPSDGNKNGQQDRKQLDQSKPIVLSPYEMQANDGLVSALYGKIGRMRPCARCDSLGSSMYSCRVLRRHSNADFDWIESFRQLGSIDHMLRMMKFGEDNSPTGCPPSPDQQASYAEARQSQNPSVHEVVRDAKLAVELATRLEKEARVAAAQAPSLSDEFINTRFPIDPSDGHFNYCIVCGLSGDVLCCEGCPNVLHPSCIGLREIPDDDWFCSKCTSISKHDSHDAGALSPRNDSRGTMKAEAIDDFAERTARLVDLLTKLRSRRQRPTKKATPRIEALTAGEIIPVGDGESDDAKGSVKVATIQVGTKVLKHFGGYGEYGGIVEQMPTKNSSFYRIRYEDSDREDLSEGEVIKLATKAKQAEQTHQSSEVPKELSAIENASNTDRTVKRQPRSRGRPRKGRVAESQQPEVELSSDPSQKERRRGAKSDPRRGRASRQRLQEFDSSDGELAKNASKRGRKSTLRRETHPAPPNDGELVRGRGIKRARAAKRDSSPLNDSELPTRKSARSHRVKLRMH